MSGVFKVSTEAIDSTVNLDGAKRSNYDPDEMVEEQRERQLRKRLNNHFKDFAAKVLIIFIDPGMGRGGHSGVSRFFAKGKFCDCALFSRLVSPFSFCALASVVCDGVALFVCLTGFLNLPR